MKTTLNHLKDLREEHAIKAIANLYAQDTDGEIASTEYLLLETALFNAFDWESSPQKEAYWDSIWKSILDGDYFDAPQHTPEEFDTKAKATMQKAAQEAHKPSILPSDATERKEYELYSGFFAYFPHAIAAVSRHSHNGSKQHNPDQPTKWDMDKSQDERDAMLRHMLEGDWEAVAWRAMANLERELTGKCQYTNNK